MLYFVHIVVVYCFALSVAFLNVNGMFYYSQQLTNLFKSFIGEIFKTNAN